LRLFFALWPPPETARALGQWANEVQRSAGGRATAEETIHLTLAFLGESDPVKASAAGRRARGTAFALPIDAAKYWRHNRIVWVGPQTMPAELNDLVAQLHSALREHAFVLEDRPFAAHITLIRTANPPRSIPPLPRVEWPCNEFLLVCSTPTRNGSRYEPVERFPLRTS
jgi:RNA 2',3'-cyclic 3'-phosphodiesterase